MKVNKLTDLMNSELIAEDLKGKSQDEVMNEMIELFSREKTVASSEGFKKALIARERISTTGIGNEIAMPHGKSDSVKESRVAFGISRDGVEWKSLDGSLVKLIFMIAEPVESKGVVQLDILKLLSGKLRNSEFREKLLAAKSKEEAFQLLEQIED
ncbi:PTS sugar transporter subunit IIA [Metabacillus sp. RGM 3146]|uniref:PTS sugar transporter subunit IIA n=1 Tax=Metabacillus sp. RGM 3146 TaxID=3401092 RepID=UPI003B9B3D89